MGFASRGAIVEIGDINEAAARETLDLVKRAGGDVLFVRTNVRTNAPEADACLRETCRAGWELPL